MTESSDESTYLTSCTDEPVLFVYADNETKFEEKVHIACTVVNINKLEITDGLTSKTQYIQGLPFVIRVRRERKVGGKKGVKSTALKIQLRAKEKIDSWSSRIAIELSAKQTESHPITFNVSNESEWDCKNSEFSYTIDWENVAKLKDLRFKAKVSADFPNGGYVWPSREATGYTGLENEGATCYINSLLQSLFCTNEFRRILYELEIDQENVNDSFVFWLKYIFYAMQFGGLIEIGIKNLIKCFDWDDMTTYTQQDIHEFLRRLMDKLEQYVDGTEFKERLTNLFVGVLEKTTRCDAVNFVTIREEHFWDLQLPIEEDEDIFGAFRTYLQPETIPDYEHESGKVEAIQETRFTSFPPVLHVQLRRFKYDPLTKTMSKINKRFEFYPKLDLRIYRPDAMYTLHSVLVHSGKMTTGHYMAYVCPNLDGQWLKFNDDMVTKCSLKQAVDLNYGNNIATPNAYILVYVKNSCIAQVLRDIPMDDVVSVDLIKNEMSKEIAAISFQEKFIEVSVHTSEKLLMNENLKRGEPLIGQHTCLTFAIEKDKSFDDFLQTLAAKFHLSQTQHIVLWMVNQKKCVFRSIDYAQISHKKIGTVVKKNAVNFFMELQPLEEVNANTFDLAKHALIFIKEYNASTDSLTFVAHQYFELQQTVQDVQAFIQEITGYEGDVKDIAIIAEKGCEESYQSTVLDDSMQLVRKFVTKQTETFSAMITFEIMDSSRKPKYESAPVSYSRSMSRSTSTSSGKSDDVPTKTGPMKRGLKPASTLSERGIHITVKFDDGFEVISEEVDTTRKLYTIIEDLCAILGITSDCVELMDSQNNVIEKDFLDASIQEFNNGRNGKVMRTRNQKQLGLVFNYRVIDNSDDPEARPSDIAEGSIDLTPISLHEDEPMECDYEEPMNCEIQPESIQLMDSEDSQMHRTPVPKNIMVKFENIINSSDGTILDCERYETLESVLDRFANKVETDKSEFSFFHVDKQLIGVFELECAIEQLIASEEMDYVLMYFEIKDKKRQSCAPMKQSTPGLKVPVITRNRKVAKKQEYDLKFEDRLKINDDVDLSFDGQMTLSKAINQLVEVMDLNRSNTMFFTSKGETIPNDSMKETISEFLANNSPTITYKMMTDADSRSIRLVCVSPSGIDLGIEHFRFTETTTVGQLCAENRPKNMELRVTKIMDDNIISIVPPETMVVDIINDGFEYHINQYMHGILLDKDSFFVCVSFMKNKRKKRLPIIIEILNGETLIALKFRLIQVLQLNITRHTHFEFQVDPKWVCTRDDQHTLVAPLDRNEIPLIRVCSEV